MGGVPAKSGASAKEHSAMGGASVKEHSATGGASVKDGTSVTGALCYGWSISYRSTLLQEEHLLRVEHLLRKLECRGGPLAQARLQQRNICKSRESGESKGVLGCCLDIKCFLS